MTQDRDPPQARSGYALWIAAALMPSGAALVVLRSVDAVGVATAGLACVLAFGLGWRATRRGQRGAATALLAAAGLSSGIAGALAAALLDRMPAASLAGRRRRHRRGGPPATPGWSGRSG